ncbi:hypothetical protein DOT_2344 [Desulfosporosinus sp. OT]|nr:hypothetical protein DOT_2344 [Desulfosporosinus sp. OT]
MDLDKKRTLPGLPRISGYSTFGPLCCCGMGKQIGGFQERAEESESEGRKK